MPRARSGARRPGLEPGDGGSSCPARRVGRATGSRRRHLTRPAPRAAATRLKNQARVVASAGEAACVASTNWRDAPTPPTLRPLVDLSAPRLRQPVSTSGRLARIVVVRHQRSGDGDEYPSFLNAASTTTGSFSFCNASNFGAQSCKAEATQPQAAETPLLPTAQAVCSRSRRSLSSTSSADASLVGPPVNRAQAACARAASTRHEAYRAKTAPPDIRHGGVEPARSRRVGRRGTRAWRPHPRATRPSRRWAHASNTGAKPSSKEASASSAACWAFEACCVASVHTSLLRFPCSLLRRPRCKLWTPSPQPRRRPRPSGRARRRARRRSRRPPRPPPPQHPKLGRRPRRLLMHPQRRAGPLV